MGEMVPDFSDVGGFTTLIFDTRGILDYQISTTTFESLLIDLRNESKKAIDNRLESQRWLRDFLEPKCQSKGDFYEKFKLRD